ncbi:hypothetical protein ACWEV3_42845 [Saccharopolyspora sp. NPDC003752]
MPKARRAHDLVTSVPPHRLVAALVQQLAEAVGGQAAYCVPAVGRPADLNVIAASPEHLAVRGGLPDEAAREPVRGGGLLLVAGTRRWGAKEQAAIRETAGWLGVTAEVDRLRADRDRAEARARGLRAEVTAARERLAQVRDLERRRLVRAITTTTQQDLDGVRRRLRGLGELMAEDAALPQLAELGTAVDEMLDNFRTVVRGVYPAMLPERGPRAALEELAATLPHPVRFDGELGRRVGWEVESGFYHAVASVLNLLAGKGISPDPAVAVEFGRDDALRARVTATAGQLSTRDLRAALDHDAGRLAVLGGAMECAVSGGEAVVTVRLADRVTPTATPPRAEVSALYQQVWDLVRQGRRAAGDSPDRSRWDAVATRMAMSARLAVVTDAAADPVEVARASALGVTVVVADGPADWALAEEFLADEGPHGSVDAVLCLVQPDPAFRSALRRGRQRVELSESASLDQLARKLIAWAPVLAARRAIVAVRALLPGLPGDHPLWWEVDRIATEAHEITELDLLDEISAGDTRVLHGVADDAARLLGAHGADPHARLGLDQDANEEQVQAAAQREALRWRTHAGKPGTSGRDRMACEVLVRTAEGLLSAARAR